MSERLEPVYIGHLPKDLTDELLKKILVQCGCVLKITRSRTPVTEEPASFCLAEFDNVESVWKVIHLINDLPVGSGRLIVKCPARTREIVDRWHNNRSYHMHKSHPAWSQEKIDAEFLAAEEPLREALTLVVRNVEESMHKARLEKAADDKARASRLELLKNRAQERRNESEGGSSTSTITGAPKRQRLDDDAALPPELLARQKHRVETYHRRTAELTKHIEEAKLTWDRTVESLKRKAERREEDIVYKWSKAIPSHREAWNQLKAELSGHSAVLTVSYACSNGTSPLYDLDGRLANEASRLATDSHDIPTARYWAHKISGARELMRQAEKEDEARGSFLVTKRARVVSEAAREEFRRVVAQVDSDAPPIASKPPSSGEIDWDLLLKKGVFSSGELRSWLVERTTEFVGAEDADDMAEYILDQFPPRAATPPTVDSLIGEMREFLDVETEDFVRALWDRIKRWL